MSAAPYVNASAPAYSGNVDHEAGRFLRLDRLRRRTTSHKVFIALSIITIVTAAHLAIGQGWGLLIQKSNYPMEVLMRIFTIGNAILIIMNEIELTRFTRDSLILRSFATRGLYYMFIGCVGNVENDIGSDNMYTSWGNRYNRYRGMDQTVESVAEIYIMCISLVTMIIGLIYVVMGIFCLNRVQDKVRVDYQARMEEYKREGGLNDQKDASCVNASCIEEMA
mmetsp:Transcript_31387/g.93921  ORF Transcript_31387/g.93921 Transcript_31387/m.93921 type:complete len:223 (-) Transcript_31387:228-896(-)|eukprot:CAMPEP_0113533640 /NCGR_PEP_ID=MMETSP0015_2-20120614/4722_1 /TAXON_ID=2838 /ORGANISM="Odontella" /LENGTH=222 /DNA_ID=CAMNT_0000432725 /DNA_START=504 /DNA_END=1172 /DNA_ORIENTATION=+ /assembly_acc=CAM_ASM_000160